MHLFCILGATASGKTALSIQLAQYIQNTYKKDVEIISLDSALVYKDMNIGTAKPTILEMQGIKHHLIDIISPTTNYNVGNFLNDVQKITFNMQTQDKIILIVGGTMLYYHALCKGLHDIPSQNAQIRQKINQQAIEYGWQYLHQYLYDIDPLTANKIEINDSQRIQRALEIYYISGKVPNYFYSQSKNSDYTLTTIALIPERNILHERIKQRFYTMLENGFINEVEQLLIKYPSLNKDSSSIRCVGYRQCYEYLHNTINYEQFIEMGLAATRQLAKRQITWLRKTQCEFIDPLQNNIFSLVKDKFDGFMQSNIKTLL